MRAIDLAYNDLLQILRDKQTALFLVIMPVAFTLLFGFLFGGFSARTEEDPRLPIGYLDQDGGAMADQLIRFLEASTAVRPVNLGEGDDPDEMVAQEDLAGAVIFPAGFSAALKGEQPISATVIVEEGTPAGMTALGEIRAGLNRLQSAVRAAQQAVLAYENELAFQDDSSRRRYYDEAFNKAVSAWVDPPLAVETRMARASTQPAQELDNAFAHSSPGMMAQFAIAGLIGAAGVIVQERKQGALSRLLTTSISRGEIILGHFLAMAAMVFTQFALLIVFGQLFLRLDYFSQPWATLAITVAAVLFAASLGLLLGTLAKTEDQVVIFTLVPMFVLSGLGGAWVPLEFTSRTVQTIGHFSPVAWIMDGYKNILLRGAGLTESLLPAGILLGFTALFVVLSVWRFKFE